MGDLEEVVILRKREEEILRWHEVLTWARIEGLSRGLFPLFSQASILLSPAKLVPA